MSDYALKQLRFAATAAAGCGGICNAGISKYIAEAIRHSERKRWLVAYYFASEATRATRTTTTTRTTTIAPALTPWQRRTLDPLNRALDELGRLCAAWVEVKLPAGY
jgi:hypothetical protein